MCEKLNFIKKHQAQIKIFITKKHIHVFNI
jgi:hypothetical protein